MAADVADDLWPNLDEPLRNQHRELARRAAPVALEEAAREIEADLGSAGAKAARRVRALIRLLAQTQVR